MTDSPVNRSAVGKKSKRKGSSFERKICKRFQEWTGIDFHRTPASGGRRWGERFEVRGDVVCEDQTFPFSIECKNRKNWGFNQLFAQTGPIFEDWWPQTIKDAKDTNKQPMLILHRERDRDYVIIKQVNDLVAPETILLISSANLIFCTLEDLLISNPGFWRSDGESENNR